MPLSHLLQQTLSILKKKPPTIFLNPNQSSKQITRHFQASGYFLGVQGSLGPSMTSKGFLTHLVL